MAHIVEKLNGERFIDLGSLYYEQTPGKIVRNDVALALTEFMQRLDDELPEATERELLIAAEAFSKGFRAGEINAGRADADNPEAEKSAPSAQD